MVINFGLWPSVGGACLIISPAKEYESCLCGVYRDHGTPEMLVCNECHNEILRNLPERYRWPQYWLDRFSRVRGMYHLFAAFQERADGA